MIIFGFSKVTKKKLGTVMTRACTYCNSYSTWDLCIVRTWFTLFFIPIVPYKIKYCISCSNCESYIPLKKNQFMQLKSEFNNSNSSSNYLEPKGIDYGKYMSKDNNQINFLKTMENNDKNITE